MDTLDTHEFQENTAHSDAASSPQTRESEPVADRAPEPHLLAAQVHSLDILRRTGTSRRRTPTLFTPPPLVRSTPLFLFGYAPSAPTVSEEGSSSDGSDADDPAPENMQCPVCLHRKVAVEFRGCIHRLCKSCTKKIWWTRIENAGHWPSSFPCPECRSEVGEVRVLCEDLGSAAAEQIWRSLVAWMKRVSKRAAARACA